MEQMSLTMETRKPRWVFQVGINYIEKKSWGFSYWILEVLGNIRSCQAGLTFLLKIDGGKWHTRRTVWQDLYDHFDQDELMVIMIKLNEVDYDQVEWNWWWSGWMKLIMIRLNEIDDDDDDDDDSTHLLLIVFLLLLVLLVLAKSSSGFVPIQEIHSSQFLLDDDPFGKLVGCWKTASRCWNAWWFTAIGCGFLWLALRLTFSGTASLCSFGC